MKKPKSEKLEILHEKLKKHKDVILKEHAKGKSIHELARMYGINDCTLGDWVYFWKNGIRRRRMYKKGIRPGERVKTKRKFSQELRNQMRINTIFNDKLIRYAKDD